MAFGLSGEDGRPKMLGADVVIAYWDANIEQPKVVDYAITHLAQCDGNRGVCPDEKLGGNNDAVLSEYLYENYAHYVFLFNNFRVTLRMPTHILKKSDQIRVAPRIPYKCVHSVHV